MLSQFEDNFSVKQPGVLHFGGVRMALLDIQAGFWGIRRQIEPLLGSSLTNSILQQAGVNGGASFAKSFTPSLKQSGAEAFLACLQIYQAAGFGQFDVTSLEWPIGKIKIQADQTFESWMMTQNDHPSNIPCCAYTAGVLVGFINIISSRKDVVCIEHTCQGMGDNTCQFELLSADEAQDQSVVSFSPDPGLSRQLNLLDMLFERMPMGIAVLDSQFRIQRFNPTWKDFSTQYAPPNSAPLVPGINYFDHLPGTEDTVIPHFKRVLAGETVQQKELKLVTGKKVSYWDVVLAPLIEDGKVNGILNVTVDATERVEANQNLEHRVKERTSELKTLLQVSQDINATLDIEALLDMILDQLKTVVDYSGASILTLDDDDLVMRVYRGPIPKEEAQRIRFPTSAALVNNEVIQQKKLLIIPDTRGKSDLAQMFQKTAGQELETTFSYIRSWMGVPLMAKGVMLGMLTLDHEQTNYFSPQHAELVQAFANQAAVAIENARLYQETERRAEESEALFSVQKAIASQLDMDEVLQLIADKARQLTNTDISAVYILEGDELEISYVSGDVSESILGYRLSIEDSIAGRVIKRQESILVPDTWTDSRVDRAASDKVQARSLLIVPLISGGEPIGTITVSNRTPGGFTPNDEELLSKLAANVVISLENARLYQAEFDRRQVAETMGDIVAVLNSSQSLQETLNFIVNRASLVMDAQAAIIHKIDYEKNFVSIEASHGLPEALQSTPGFPLYSSPDADSQILNRQPVWVSGFKKRPQPTEAELVALDPNVRTWRQITNKHYQSWLAVPLVIGEEVYGSLAFYFNAPKDFNDEEIALASTFSDQAALAIENTRLYEAAETAAVSAERNRLARDLHDAVTQTLFSASVIADVLPKIWTRDVEEGQRRLEELRQLTRGALSEMRTLLVELRPAALIDTNITDLIGHQVNAFKARTRLQLEYLHSCDFDPPPKIKEAFYRITQEAFNNIAKHADASAVTLNLVCRDGTASLDIKDDGVGFEPKSARAEGLGLNIMRERAANVNAKMVIHSKHQRGTHLKITWQAQQDKEQRNDR